jgi:hypothetical protein
MSISNAVLNEEEIREIYEWVDGFELSRIKRNFGRDFSDGVLIAEIMKEYYPQLVWIHCYSSVNSLQERKNNWALLNKKVFHHISFPLSQSEVNSIINIEEHAVEKFLFRLKRFLEQSAEKIKESLNTKDKVKKGIEKIRENIQRKKKGIEVYDSNDDKSRLLNQLQDTIEILEKKVGKLELDIKSKDDKIFVMSNKLKNNGIEV